MLHLEQSSKLFPLRCVLKRVALAMVVAVLAGSASAVFLFSLDWATQTRNTSRWLMWGLPLAGFAVGWLYLKLGQHVEAGSNLLIDEINDPQKVVLLRMAPLVLGGTVISHLFGASVGREGTAVQMGGALADQLTHCFKLKHVDRRMVLMAGISAGFASVFGTPLAGAVFALEVLAIGRMRLDALLPCVIAAVTADQVGLWWGVQHTAYVLDTVPQITPWLLLVMVLAGAVFGLAGKVFADGTHALSGWMKQHIAYAPLRPLLGGAVIATVVMWGNFDRYMGLGIPVMVEAFVHPLAPTDFLGKMVFTVASLGSGFKGGEVTPLFYIGATLGNALAPLFDVPFALLAAVGFVAVFAGAANTPIASTLMAMELFGAELGVFAALACVMSYVCSGHSGIYRAQRVAHRKTDALLRMLVMTLFLSRLLCIACFGLALCSPAAWAQTFKMPCEVEGVIPALDDLKIKPQKVVIEIQSMGKNIFLKMNGAAPYLVQASSLTTEEFSGKSLTTSKEMGAFRKHKVTGAESEIRIDQATVVVAAYSDIEFQGKKVRIQITGPCAVPR